MLKESVAVLKKQLAPIVARLKELAIKYRHTIMMARTHGQEAEIQSFGKRCLTWLVDLQLGLQSLEKAEENLRYSKLSGAIGNYQGIGPEVEKETLRILGFEPFYGATQILPRELFAPVAQAICQIVLSLDKIALDIRLGARSGMPLMQEPFGKGQTGSSAMPHKKNTINTEKLEGMARAAEGFFSMIMSNIVTWEERAIEQSSVERIAWPDLLHVAVHATKTMNTVLQGLAVYPDMMLREIINSRGCYAAAGAKEFLRHHVTAYGLGSEEAYRMVQLAAFNVFAPNEQAKAIRLHPPTSLSEAKEALMSFREEKPELLSIQDVIAEGKLIPSDQLEATRETVERWNSILMEIFSDPDAKCEWEIIFDPSWILREEDVLYQKILGI